jgi:hypothetical protein
MTRWVKHAARPLVVVGAILGIESAAEPLRAQNCSDGGILVSALAVTGLAVFDIATAPASARRHNEAPVIIAPYVSARGRSFGLSVSWFYRRPMPVAPRPVRRLPAVTSDSTRPHKSPGTAFALSFLSTAAPIAVGVGMNNGGGAGVFLAGGVVGPSVGHFYAGQTVRGVVTAGLRGAGTALFINSLAACWFD